MREPINSSKEVFWAHPNCLWLSTPRKQKAFVPFFKNIFSRDFSAGGGFGLTALEIHSAVYPPNRHNAGSTNFSETALPVCLWHFLKNLTPSDVLHALQRELGQSTASPASSSASQRLALHQCQAAAGDIPSALTALPLPHQLMRPVAEVWGCYCPKERFGAVLCIKDWEHCKPLAMENDLPPKPGQHSCPKEGNDISFPYAQTWSIKTQKGHVRRGLLEPGSGCQAVSLPLIPISSTQPPTGHSPGLSGAEMGRMWSTKAKQIWESSFSARNSYLSHKAGARQFALGTLHTANSQIHHFLFQQNTHGHYKRKTPMQEPTEKSRGLKSAV